MGNLINHKTNQLEKMDAKPAGPVVCRVQHPAPDFSAEVYYPDSGLFKQVKLSDFKGKYLVLMWYPLDFTLVCPTEIIKFSDAKPEFDAMDCVVLACSVDSVHSHKEWSKKERKKGGLDPMALPMLSDLTHKISADYGCLTDGGCTLRATYIIDDKGVLRHIGQNDLPVGREVTEYIRLVQAFQYSDKYGEVCPASWKPGKKTMKPDHDAD